MAYLTFQNLSTRSFSKAENLNESLSADTFPKTKIFLSYRREDKLYVASVVSFMKKIAISVYVDYLDKTLEDQTNEHIAQILRQRIHGCKKFISLATPNSTKSKWIPWELGLGDRIVNYLNVAVLPLTNDSNAWSDQEYGKIYGHIESDYSFNVSDSNDWYVKYPDNRKIKFKDWIKN